MGSMQLVPANNGEDTFDIRTLGPVVHAAQMQYQRQLKTLQALQNQLELTTESNAAWRERERRREEKYANISQERQTQREQLAEHGHRMAEKRADRLEAAYRHEEVMRTAAQAKVQAVEERRARFAEEQAQHLAAERQRIAELEAKREVTYRNNLELMEARRQSILAQERRVEDMLRQREELRRLQAQIKAEEEFLREQHRKAIKARAEDGLAERVALFHAKQAAKEEQTERRKKEVEDQRRMRADELRQRFDYIAAQAREAAGASEAYRQALAGRLEDKVARGETLAAHRAALLSEMASLRHQMQQQEEYLRTSIMRIQQQGAVTVPEEVRHSLEGLKLAGPLMATAMLAGGPGTSTRRVTAPEQMLMLEGAGGGIAASEYGGVGGAMTPQRTVPPRGHSAFAGGLRPKSAGPTPRGVSSLSASGRAYASAMTSPRVTTGNGDGGGAAPRVSGPSVLLGNSPATLVGSGPSPYSPYPAHPAVDATGAMSGGGGGGGGGQRASLKEQVDAATDTSTRAVEATASGRYSSVHEVARPGSRREEELRAVLQEEIAKESERQAILVKVTDDDERARLVKFFTLEREEARKRILALSSAAQAALYH